MTAEEQARRLVDAAPPLSPRQRAVIGAALRRDRPRPPADPPPEEPR